jgi:hypothetical protein
MKYPAIKVNLGDAGFLNMNLPMNDIPTLKEILKKHNGWACVEIRRPHKPRTTGRHSQGNHINGHIQQIVDYTGDDFNHFKYMAKCRAVKRGYPYETNIDGEIVPWSETKLSTVQAGYLIEQLHEDAAFLGIILREDYDE